MSPPTSRVSANGIEIAYETFGDAADPPVVLVMGLATSMLGWPEPFCEDLAEHGYLVVRFDNRDVGLSTHLHDLPVPTVRDLLARRPGPYALEDMADDVVGLLDALGLGSVHLVGASLGGYVCQSLALRHPDRLRSLALLMSSTGSRRVGKPRRSVLRHLVRAREATSREEAVEQALTTLRLVSSPGHPFDEGRIREFAGRSYDRSYDPGAARRQAAVGNSAPDRTAALATLDLPTLVVHGLDDPLVDVSGGLALARAVPHSTFVGFAGMGHDLPRALWPDLVDQLVLLASRADADRLP
jgi:pimeloyl-ACP methyl ester carboxylesterase